MHVCLNVCLMCVCVSAYAFMYVVGVYVHECVCVCVFPCVRKRCIKCQTIEHKFILNWLPQKNVRVCVWCDFEGK